MVVLRAEEYALLHEVAWFESRRLTDAWPPSVAALATLEELLLVVVSGGVCTITPRGRRVASAPVHERTETTVIILRRDT